MPEQRYIIVPQEDGTYAVIDTASTNGYGAPWVEIAALIAHSHAVYIYPRKELVIIDGYKYYRLIHASERGER
jgi:hypothetical protein